MLQTFLNMLKNWAYSFAKNYFGTKWDNAEKSLESVLNVIEDVIFKQDPTQDVATSRANVKAAVDEALKNITFPDFIEKNEGALEQVIDTLIDAGFDFAASKNFFSTVSVTK